MVRERDNTGDKRDKKIPSITKSPEHDKLKKAVPNKYLGQLLCLIMTRFGNAF